MAASTVPVILSRRRRISGVIGWEILRFAQNDRYGVEEDGKIGIVFCRFPCIMVIRMKERPENYDRTDQNCPGTYR